MIRQTFDLALQHHRAGRLDQAEQLYQLVLSQQPEHADATHNMGVIALQSGRIEIAELFIRRAIVLAPNMAAAHSSLGNVLIGNGKLQDAID